MLITLHYTRFNNMYIHDHAYFEIGPMRHYTDSSVKYIQHFAVLDYAVSCRFWDYVCTMLYVFCLYGIMRILDLRMCGVLHILALVLRDST